LLIRITPFIIYFVLCANVRLLLFQPWYPRISSRVGATFSLCSCATRFPLAPAAEAAKASNEIRAIKAALFHDKSIRSVAAHSLPSGSWLLTLKRKP
jgi:hypothetical protein